MKLNNYVNPEWVFNYHHIIYYYDILTNIQRKGHGDYTKGVEPTCNIYGCDKNLIFIL